MGVGLFVAVWLGGSILGFLPLVEFYPLELLGVLVAQLEGSSLLCHPVHSEDWVIEGVVVTGCLTILFFLEHIEI